MAVQRVPIEGIYDDVSGRLIGMAIQGADSKLTLPEGTPRGRLYSYLPLQRAAPSTLQSASSAGYGARAIAVITGIDYDLVSDGTNWRPANGEASIRVAQGTVATPYASLTTTGAASLITLPADIAIPSKMIVPNSRFRVEAEFARSGSGGTITVGAYLGNNKTLADPLMGTVDFTTAQTSLWVEFTARFGSSVNTYYAANGAHQKGQGAASAFVDRTIVGANTAYISFGTTANVAGDTLTLLGCRVTQEV